MYSGLSSHYGERQGDCWSQVDRQIQIPQNRGEYYSIYMEKISWLLNRSLNTG